MSSSEPTAGSEGAVPVACTLTADDVTARVGDWQSVLSDVRRRVPLQDGVRLELDASPALLAELARLSLAEHECCRFFSFAITVDERGVGLEVVAPEAGQPALASLFGGDA